MLVQPHSESFLQKEHKYTSKEHSDVNVVHISSKAWPNHCFLSDGIKRQTVKQLLIDIFIVYLPPPAPMHMVLFETEVSQILYPRVLQDKKLTRVKHRKSGTDGEIFLYQLSFSSVSVQQLSAKFGPLLFNFHQTQPAGLMGWHQFGLSYSRILVQSGCFKAILGKINCDLVAWIQEQIRNQSKV